MPIHRHQKIDGLGMRGVLHGHDALLDRLKSRSEHGCGQFGYALAIANSGFDPFLDQPLLQFNIFRGLFTPTSACIAAVKFLTFFVANS